MARQNISSASAWEPLVGYSRAVRVGGFVAVAGTTDTAAGDAYGQTAAALAKIEAALQQAGASRRDVVRTRIFVRNIDAWEEIGRAHREFFGDIMPAATMVEVSRFVDPAILVEIEADAVIEGTTQ
jgi:enamine deaminase RidA (YjgF/YER057c/UK114 family)